MRFKRDEAFSKLCMVASEYILSNDDPIYSVFSWRPLKARNYGDPASSFFSSGTLTINQLEACNLRNSS